MNTTSEGCSWVEYWGFIFVLLTVYTERLCCMGTEDDLHSEEILEAELYKKQPCPHWKSECMHKQSSDAMTKKCWTHAKNTSVIVCYFTQSISIPVNATILPRIVATGRITSGIDTTHRQHPWIAYLRMCYLGNKYCKVCGGTYISRKHGLVSVLTAKHCLEDECQGLIIYGSADKGIGRKSLFRCRGRRIKEHEDIDLAIIETEPNPEVKPLAIPLGSHEVPTAGQKVMAAGWGTTCMDGDSCERKPSDKLKQVQLEIMLQSQCYYGDEYICAIGVDGKDTCEGDSGGPLVCRDKLNRKFLCGVIALGPPTCGLAELPAAYLNVGLDHVLSWIRNNSDASSKGRITLDDNRNIEGEEEIQSQGCDQRKHSNWVPFSLGIVLLLIKY